MNTKYFFLLLGSLLIATTTSSIVNTRLEENTSAEYTSFIEQSKKILGPIDIQLPQAPAERPDVHHEEKSPLQPEDGKHHRFHFMRLAKARRRELKCLCCKIILAIGHICCLIYCILHAFH